jgi:hypothetical protein
VTDIHETKALAIIPRSVGELMQLAEILAKSELLPKALRGKVADVAMQIMAGAEMGFGPGAALRNMNIIEGKPVLSASGKVALVKASGKCKYFDCIEDTDERVTYETMRVGATVPRRATWTKQRVKDAGLNSKDNHRLFGKQMLDARAKSELCENTYEDVLAGIATEEEIGDWLPPQQDASRARPATPTPVDAIDAELATPAESLLAQIDAAESHDALTALKEQLKSLPEADKAEARKRYTARWDALKPQPSEEKAS